MWPGPLKQYFRYFAGVVLFYKAPHVPVPVNRKIGLLSFINYQNNLCPPLWILMSQCLTRTIIQPFSGVIDTPVLNYTRLRESVHYGGNHSHSGSANKFLLVPLLNFWIQHYWAGQGCSFLVWPPVRHIWVVKMELLCMQAPLCRVQGHTYIARTIFTCSPGEKRTYQGSFLKPRVGHDIVHEKMIQGDGSWDKLDTRHQM